MSISTNSLQAQTPAVQTISNNFNGLNQTHYLAQQQLQARTLDAVETLAQSLSEKMRSSISSALEQAIQKYQGSPTQSTISDGLKDARNILGSEPQTDTSSKIKDLLTSLDSSLTSGNLVSDKDSGLEHMLEQITEILHMLVQMFQSMVEKPSAADGTAANNGTAPSAGAGASGGAAHSKGPSFKVKAPKGFLWKPVADSGGKLVILLPSKFSHSNAKVRVLSPDRKSVLGTGKFSGVGNGDRAHFRFQKKGSEFPVGSIVQVSNSKGELFSVTINHPDARNE